MKRRGQRADRQADKFACSENVASNWSLRMKAYLMTSGGIFALLVVAHLLRIIAEGPHVARDPWFGLSTVAAGALCVWALRLLRRTARS
jgi:hypothetical protein